jgi:hypothetical protein
LKTSRHLKPRTDRVRSLCVNLDPPSDTSRLPLQGRDAPEDAVDDWLAHIAAGRVQVR